MSQSSVRIVLIFFTLLLSKSLFGQGVDKAFIDQWLKLCDDKIEVDSLKAYFIDREYFTDPAKINTRLSAISARKIKSILYSKMKMDNYVPGKGTAYITTIQRMDLKDAEQWMKKVKELYVDKYISLSHTLSDSKDPALVIDGQSISPPIARAALYKISPDEIYDISVNGFFPVPTSLFGQNAKNGLVQIWTKQNYKD